MKATVLILLSTLLCVSGVVYGQYGQYDWPMLHGCRERTAWAQFETELAPPFESQYYYQFTGGTRLSYANGILLIGDNSWIHAIDSGSESEMWTFQIPNAGGAIGCVPAFAESLVLCGGQGGDGLFALHKDTGHQIWSKPIGSLYARNPIPDENRVYIVQDSLYCLDIHDGSTRWSYPVSGQTTPTVDDSNVYVYGNTFNKFTGDFKWNGGYYGGYFLSVDAQYVYASGSSSSEIVAHRKSDGQNQWRYEIPDGVIIGYFEGAGAISDQFLCFVVWQTTDGKSALYTLDKATGTYVWHYVFDDEGVYQPVIANDIVYLTDWTNHDLWGFNITNGDVVLRDDTEDYWYQPIVADHSLYVLVYWGGVRIFRSSTTSVQTNVSSKTPQAFDLAQNYPNPFNAVTDIRYEIADSRYPTHITLKIFNILGQEVRTLVDGAQQPGYYTVTWDGRNKIGMQVPSGVYFYNIKAGDFTATRRMLLLK